MKNHARNALIALLALIFILSITRSAKAAGPTINLPTGTVNATYTYTWSNTNSYWTITLSSVPPGYDVTSPSATYVGWCCDETNTIVDGSTLSVNLYSSYASNNPWEAGTVWNKVNYILNHKNGTAEDVQAAIWHYINSGGGTIDTFVTAMIGAADQYGSSFVPTHGQLLAVVLYLTGSQACFIEVTVPTVQLTVTSAYDSPSPSGTTFYDSGTSVTASVTSPVAGSGGTQYVCTGWTGTGSVVSGTGTSVTFTITQNSTLTWIWQTQYWLTVTSPYGTPGGGGWYPSGNTAYATLSSGGPVSGGTGTRYVFNHWGGDASGTGLTSAGITMSDPKTATAVWTTQYYLTVLTSPSGIGTIAGAGWYNAGQSVPLTAPINLGSYRLITDPFSWDVDGASRGVANSITVTMNAPYTATAHYNDFSVGGQWAPITMQALSPMGTLGLLAPWIALALIAAGTVAAAYRYRRLFKKYW